MRRRLHEPLAAAHERRARVVERANDDVERVDGRLEVRVVGMRAVGASQQLAHQHVVATELAERQRERADGLHRDAHASFAKAAAAYDERLDRKIAVKHLHLTRGDGTQGEARMLREAQALARVSHPNVVQVYEVGEHQREVYIAMEFVPGRTLRAWSRAQVHPWREVLEVYLQAGRGLAAAHAAGVVHRDFKPDNVMLGDDGRVRVMDFGLARPLAAAGSNAFFNDIPDLVFDGNFIEPIDLLDTCGRSHIDFGKIAADDVDPHKNQPLPF